MGGQDDSQSGFSTKLHYLDELGQLPDERPKRVAANVLRAKVANEAQRFDEKEIDGKQGGDGRGGDQRDRPVLHVVECRRVKEGKGRGRRKRNVMTICRMLHGRNRGHALRLRRES